MREIIVIGASDTFDLVLSSLEHEGRRIAGYLGPEANKHSLFADYPYLGDDSFIDTDRHRDADFVVSVYDNERRRDLVDHILGSGRSILSVFHPTSVIYPSAECGEGTLIAPLATVSTRASVGRSVYVNYGALIGHDVAVGDFSFVSPGAKVLGEAAIGRQVLIGANAVILPQVRVGDGARIGANVVVSGDVPADVTVLVQQRNRTFKVEREG